MLGGPVQASWSLLVLDRHAKSPWGRNKAAVTSCRGGYDGLVGWRHAEATGRGHETPIAALSMGDDLTPWGVRGYWGRYWGAG